MTENGKPLFLLIILANANVQTVAVCLVLLGAFKWSCVYRVYEKRAYECTPLVVFTIYQKAQSS